MAIVPQIPQKTISNFTAFTLTADPLDGCNKRSSFLFSERGGFPRFTVFYGSKDTRGCIYAPMDLSGVIYILDDIIKLTEEPKGTKRMVSCSNVNYETIRDGVPVETIEIARVYYGKDEEGVIWICLENKVTESPKIKFTFDFNRYVVPFDSSGKPIEDKSVLSCLAAKCKCLALKELYNIKCNSVNLTVQQQLAPQPPKEAFIPSSKIDLDEVSF